MTQILVLNIQNFSICTGTTALGPSRATVPRTICSADEPVLTAADTDTQGLQKDTACVICFEKEGDHVLLPCGHGGYCGDCTKRLLRQPSAKRLCPVCRAKLRVAARVHLSTPVGEDGDILEHSTARREKGKRRSTRRLREYGTAAGRSTTTRRPHAGSSRSVDASSGNAPVAAAPTDVQPRTHR